jgi:hypothetical protein
VEIQEQDMIIARDQQQEHEGRDRVAYEGMEDLWSYNSSCRSMSSSNLRKSTGTACERWKRQWWSNSKRRGAGVQELEKMEWGAQSRGSTSSKIKRQQEAARLGGA